MRKPGIETTVSVIAVLISAAVLISGFLVYRSLTEIVSSIHDESSSDYRLIVVKDIALDLMEIESNIQLYTITKNKSNLNDYKKANKRLEDRIAVLVGLPSDNMEKSNLNDSVKILAELKLKIWDEIRRINSMETDATEQFEELYSMLEKKEIDTVKVEVEYEVEPPPKKGIFRKIFSKKDTVQTLTRVDTTLIEKTVESEEIKEEIQQLETELKEREQQKNRRELQLIEQNIQISGQLNNLIARIEKSERDSLIEKNDEKDQLAKLIYSRLSVFAIIAVVLLIVVLYLFVLYLQRSRRYQKVLTSAKHEAERLAKAKEVFMANVSHEMRTPVNAIYGLTEQVLQQQTSAKVKEQLGILLKSTIHLKNVVEDTLDFSKIQAKKLKFRKVDFSPESIIKEIITLHQPEASAKNIDLFYRNMNQLPLALLGDPFRLKQILINTIGNAIKFTEKGSVNVIVRSKELNADHFRLSFQIEDTGIGISKENLGHIFEDFVQVESDYTRKFSGTGLGLSIVKRLIELQDGTISIESELNKGTQVSFHIPYKKGNPINIEQLKQEEVAVPKGVRGLKILGVDDEEFNRYLLKVIFEKWGVNYHEASNGNEAVELALQNDYDLILMDLRMPDLNGIEASKQIIKAKPEQKIIAIAAITGESEMKLCREAGMSNFISKPFSESDLMDTINSALEINNKEYIDAGEEFKLDEMERLANGDKVFLKEMIRIFIRSTENGVRDIKSALEEESWQQISDAAHKMAAPCKHIMANGLYEKIKLLEKNAENQESLQYIPNLISQIEQKVTGINTSLTQLLDSEQFS